MQLIVLFCLPTMTYIIVVLNFLAAWKTAGISRGFSKWNSPFKLTALSSFLLASCLKTANLTAKNHHYCCAGGEKSLVVGTLHGTLERDTQFHLPWQVELSELRDVSYRQIFRGSHLPGDADQHPWDSWAGTRGGHLLCQSAELQAPKSH